MIFEMLSEGKKNARTAKQLCHILGTDTRSITQAVERERRSGKPICATCDSANPGYYIPDSQQEMQRYCERLRRREKEIAKTRRACAKTIPLLPDTEDE